ncbi:hypothetical protein, partial [Endozoicomonas sp. ONNA2]|uniref:hypothetical protein n=1 Tax=Endozoicomonas sp. ONNA2 TaxID=2828741 RepID=UPI0021496964
AENVHISTSGDNAHAGIGAGVVDGGGMVTNTTVVNSTVETSGKIACAGTGGGVVLGTVANTTAVNSRVETSGENALAGIGGGIVWVKGTVANTTAVNSCVTTSGKFGNAGIGGGDVFIRGTVANTTAVNSYVDGTKVDIGSVANDQLLCQKADPRVLTANCSARTEFLDALGLSYSDAGPVNAATSIADGSSTKAMNTKVETSGKHAGIGAGRHAPHHVGRRSVGDEGMIADMDGSNAAAATTAATMGITTGSLLAAGGLGIVGFTGYQWITGYQEGLRGQELAMKPLTRGKELASAAVNSVSQGIKGIRERMNRQSVPAQKPAHEINELGTDWDGVI